MLGFRHPRPFIRKEVAMQVARQESRAFSATELQVELLARPEVAPPPDDAPIRFSVAYGLGEYLSIVHDHLAFLCLAAAQQERLRGLFLSRVRVALLLAVRPSGRRPS